MDTQHHAMIAETQNEQVYLGYTVEGVLQDATFLPQLQQKSMLPKGIRKWLNCGKELRCMRKECIAIDSSRCHQVLLNDL